MYPSLLASLRRAQPGDGSLPKSDGLLRRSSDAARGPIHKLPVRAPSESRKTEGDDDSFIGAEPDIHRFLSVLTIEVLSG